MSTNEDLKTKPFLPAQASAFVDQIFDAMEDRPMLHGDEELAYFLREQVTSDLAGLKECYDMEDLGYPEGWLYATRRSSAVRFTENLLRLGLLLRQVPVA